MCCNLLLTHPIVTKFADLHLMCIPSLLLKQLKEQKKKQIEYVFEKEMCPCVASWLFHNS